METAERVMDRWDVSDPTAVSLSDRLGSAMLPASRELQTRRSIKSTESEKHQPKSQEGQKRCKVIYILRRFSVQLAESNGEPGGARTRDHRIKSAMLYQLSYRLLRMKTGRGVISVFVRLT